MNLDAEKIRSYKKDLKAALTADEPSADVKRLLALHTNRINQGVEKGFQTARWYYAIDRAYDVSKDQINPTLVQDLLDRNPGVEEVQALAKEWGLDSILQKIPVQETERYTGLPVTGGNPKPGYLLQAPTFFRVLIPLVMSYTKARWAKLWNDIDLYPFLKYESHGQSLEGRLIGRLVTKRVQRMVQEMGHKPAVRDMIQKALLYSRAIAFTTEAWYTEKQLIGGVEKVVKEGQRLEIPHISRTFFDETHPLYTLNTDTGIDWMGFWTMRRFGDILYNKDYWIPESMKAEKKKRKGKGDRSTEEEGWYLASGWRSDDGYSKFYRYLFPCVVEFPKLSAGKSSKNDRDKHAFYYTTDRLDDGIDQAVFYHKLVPKDWGLYDYEYPVWHRFIYAGAQQILYCEPMFYTPAFQMGYDYDQNRSFNSSLGLELMPFQDHLGNLLSQTLLTVKKNLLRVIAVNRDIVDKDFIKKMQNFSENSLRGIELFEYSKEGLEDAGQTIDQAFQPIQFQYQSTAEIVNSVNSMIGILERLLGYSAQEIGAPASHQQSAKEIVTLEGASSNRIRLTASFRDEALTALKRMCYYGMLHYSQEDFTVTLDEMDDQAIAQLKTMGFTVKVDAGNPSVVDVSGKTSQLAYDQLFSDREGSSRSSDQQTAAIIQSFLDRFMSNPAIAQNIPLNQVFAFYNRIAEYLGLPPELKFPENVEQMSEEDRAKKEQQFQQMVMQVVAQPLEQVSQAVGQVAKQAAVSQQQVAEAGQAVEAVSSAMQQNDQSLSERTANLEKSMINLMQALDRMVVRASEPVGQ